MHSRREDENVLSPPVSHVLDDFLRPGLKLVLVGTAAGYRSAAMRAYYAHPSNRFWRTLAVTGLTPRLFQPGEEVGLIDLGIGLTDIAKTASGMDHQIAASAFDVGAFNEKMLRYSPRAVAFTSKKAASIWLGMRTARIAFGWQPDVIAGRTAVFVLPSTSGAASRTWDIDHWHRLAAWHRSVAPHRGV